MTVVGIGLATHVKGTDAAREAAIKARAGLHGEEAKLAIAFASAGYPDLNDVPRSIADELPGAIVIGGTSGGCLWSGHCTASLGVSIVAVGGPDVRVGSVVADLAGGSFDPVVSAAASLARDAEPARRTLPFLSCLAFAPGLTVDGELLVAAIRKGVGASTQLAGGLTGRSDYQREQTHIFGGGEVRTDAVVLASLSTLKPLGIAAGHGWKPVGPERVITRTDGVWLLEMDGRPAFDVWKEDVMAAGGELPEGRDKPVILYLASQYELGLMERGELGVVRAPFEIRADGAVLLSGSVPEGTRVRIVHATPQRILAAARSVAETAVARVGRASGALVLACTGLHPALGSQFPSEVSTIQDVVEAPTGGGCVFGEIERSASEVDAFHNTTSVVIAFPR